MTINIPANYTSQQILETAHNSTAIPTAIVLFILLNIFFWISAWVVLDWDKVDGRKIFGMWVIIFILTGVATLILSLSPNMVQALAEFSKTIFSV